MAKDCYDKVIAKGKQHQPLGTNNEAEVKEALVVVQLERRIGITKINLEGDSQVITHVIIQGGAKNWKIDKEM